MVAIEARIKVYYDPYNCFFILTSTISAKIINNYGYLFATLKHIFLFPQTTSSCIENIYSR